MTEETKIKFNTEIMRESVYSLSLLWFTDLHVKTWTTSVIILVEEIRRSMPLEPRKPSRYIHAAWSILAIWVVEFHVRVCGRVFVCKILEFHLYHCSVFVHCSSDLVKYTWWAHRRWLQWFKKYVAIHAHYLICKRIAYKSVCSNCLYTQALVQSD